MDKDNIRRLVQALMAVDEAVPASSREQLMAYAIMVGGTVHGMVDTILEKHRMLPRDAATVQVRSAFIRMLDETMAAMQSERQLNKPYDPVEAELFVREGLARLAGAHQAADDILSRLQAIAGESNDTGR